MTETTKTHWLTPDGAIATHVIVVEDDGSVTGESGDPAPKGTALTSEAITRMFRQDYVRESEAHVANQKRAAVAHKAAVEAEAAKIATLTEAGFSEDVIAILVPERLGKFRASEYSPPASAAQSMAAYGLDGDQIRRVLGGGF